ncbi:MAG: diguanylate cyclase [Thermodesulfobacteriota bacterium]
MSILIVDDSISSRKYLEDILNNDGYTALHLANSAEEGYKLLGLNGASTGKDDIELILLDSEMPGTSGIEATEKIRKSSYHRQIPIIMLMSSRDEQTVKTAREAGITDHVVKPPNRVALMMSIRKALLTKAEHDRKQGKSDEPLFVTEQIKAADERIKRTTSDADELTKLATRKSFDTYLQVSWAKSKRDKRKVCLLLLDVDFFRQYCEKYGSFKEDDCLKKIANLIKMTVLRPTDLVARFDYKTFGVIVPETHLKGAVILAEKLHGGVSELKLPHGEGGASAYVTATIGVAGMIPRTLSEARDLVKATEKVLLKGKSEGRDRVEAAWDVG